MSHLLKEIEEIKFKQQHEQQPLTAATSEVKKMKTDYLDGIEVCRKRVEEVLKHMAEQGTLYYDRILSRLDSQCAPAVIPPLVYDPTLAVA